MAISEEAFIFAAEDLECEVAAIKAVAQVESAGGGFRPDGSVKTLFEGHLFYKNTNGRFAKSHPTLCFPKWTKQFYGKTGAEEASRLNTAIRLDREAALKSASWGAFQILGSNYSLCGCKSVQDFVNEMSFSEDSQLKLFVEFIINSGLADELREKRWADFARKYNGPSFAVNKYDTKMAAAYAKFL